MYSIEIIVEDFLLNKYTTNIQEYKKVQLDKNLLKFLHILIKKWYTIYKVIIMDKEEIRKKLKKVENLIG